MLGWLNMNKSVSILCVALAGLFASTLCAQQIYRWKDAAGVIHFTEQPPPSGKAELVTLNANGSAQASSVDPAASAKAAQQDQEEADHRLAACINARKNLGQLTQGDFAPRADAPTADAESNATLRLTREQREAAERNAEKQIQQLCGDN
jgi:hypothetical protein